MERTEIVELILETVVKIKPATDGSEGGIPLNEETRLIGRNGMLDSLGLVNLIVDVEEEVNRRFDLSISLVDDKAMSQKHSPFATVGRLADYILATTANLEVQ
jgi:acyl carrier protein